MDIDELRRKLAARREVLLRDHSNHRGFEPKMTPASQSFIEGQLAECERTLRLIEQD